MKIKITRKDVVWSYLGTILSMGTNLVLLALAVYFLDDDMYGLWGIFASIGAISTLFDFGFSVTFARNITYCWSGASSLKKEGVNFVESREPDFKLMKKILITCKRIYLILSAAALFLLLTAGTGYVMYVSRHIEGNRHIIAWIVYAIAAFLNIYYGYYASFLRGVGAIEQTNINTVVSRGLQIVLTVVLLVCGFGLLGACIGYLAYGTSFRILGKRMFYRYEGIGEKLAATDYTPTVKEIMQLLGVVWHNAWRDGIISISEYLCSQASTVICSMYLTLAETGTYALGLQIATAIAQIASTLYVSYQPTLQEAYINRDGDKMRRTMAIIVSSYIYLFIIGVVGTVLVGIPFLKFIKPGVKISIPIILGMSLFQFMIKLRNCYTSYFSCTNRIIYMKAFLLSSILTIIFAIILLDRFGLGMWGMIIAQILSQALYNSWHWQALAHKELEFSFPAMMSMGNADIKNMVGHMLDKIKERGNR